MINIKKIIEILNKEIELKTKKGYIVKKNFAEIKKEKNDKFIQEVLAELEQNHNHSWYEELYLRNKDTLDDIALFYRGTEITYGEMFENMRQYARSLKIQGIQKGTEIPICISNTPELVYLLGAISMIGAKANIFSTEFDKDYITEVIDGCSADIIFVEDGNYEGLKESIDNSHISKIYMTSLTDSLPKEGNPYELFDQVHGKFKNLVNNYKQKNSKIKDTHEFVKMGEFYEGEILSEVNLDDEFTITYSSGSTNSTRAKAIVHTVRSFITIGRCHDTDVQKSASMKRFTIQAQIPTHSNTDIISSISDSLMQGSKLALEPIYDKDFFIDSLLINKPTYVVATRCFWIHTMKKVMFDPKYQHVKMPFLLIPFSVGEPLEKNEEKFLNKGLRKVQAGRDKIPTPFSPITMSVAGGDCEHGGIFWILFRSLQSKMPKRLIKNEEVGLNPFQMVDVAILDEKGKKCKPYQLGRLVANSPCNMKCYKNNPDATEKFFIKDASGKVWGDCNVYSYLDSIGGVHMKGRIPTKKEAIPTFLIADVILKDTKSILSCEVVENEGLYVVHIELQPKVKNVKKALYSAEQRCINQFGEDFASLLVYRMHSFEESFELTGCGKRNIHALNAEGITNQCVKPIKEDSEIELLPISEYYKSTVKVYKK